MTMSCCELEGQTVMIHETTDVPTLVPTRKRADSRSMMPVMHRTSSFLTLAPLQKGVEHQRPGLSGKLTVTADVPLL